MQAIEARANQFVERARRRRALELGLAALVTFMFASYASWFDFPAVRWSAAAVVANIAASTVALISLARIGAVAGGDEAALQEAFRQRLIEHARIYTWAPLWGVLPVYLSACAFVIGLDEVVYAAGSPSAMLPADLGMMTALAFAAAVMSLEWSRNLKVEAATIGGPRGPASAGDPPSAPTPHAAAPAAISASVPAPPVA